MGAGKKGERRTVVVGIPEYDVGDDRATVTIWDPKWVAFGDDGYAAVYERFMAAEGRGDNDAAIRDLVGWYVVEAHIPGAPNGALPERVLNALGQLCVQPLRPTEAAIIDSPDTMSSAGTC